MQENYSLVKIFGKDMLLGQVESFEFTTKGYSNIAGILVSGESETSFIFNKDSTLVIHSVDLDNDKSSDPNKRPLKYKHEIKDELIKGTVVKKGTAGRLSVYLLIK